MKMGINITHNKENLSSTVSKIEQNKHKYKEIHTNTTSNTKEAMFDDVGRECYIGMSLAFNSTWHSAAYFFIRRWLRVVLPFSFPFPPAPGCLRLH